ncbi:MAG: bifunctional metallophosphatase/5'-nucleotidase [Treponema sp.]|nr:bifunctional metallophosphatase/5'-nucleotidase [Candidatus Treponema scatequi]
MKNLLKNISKAFALFTILCAFCSAEVFAKGKKPSKDIVILYTNDVHCAVENNMGYAGLSAYKNECLKETPFVTLVDAGDAIQGEVIGAIDKGESIVKLMNAVGYDFAVYGNHEFDYGMDQLTELVKKSNAQYLCCNLKYEGNKKTFIEKTLPYKIVKYGNVKVAFIGVSTPYSIKTSTPTFFKEGDKYVYDFGTEKDGDEFIKRVQNAIDQAKKEGADYIIAISHLGPFEEPGFEKYSSVSLIKNTVGLNAVIDAHSHTVFECEKVLDKNGNAVPVTQTGTKFQNIGKLVINTKGELSTKLIYSYDEKDEKVVNLIADIKSQNEKLLGRVIATSDAKLDINNDNQIRQVRNRGCAIGNLVADSFAYAGKTQIAFTNAGGIRKALPEGDVTYGDALSIMPFGNMLCTAEVSGQTILDALEFAYRKVEKETIDETGKKAVGEDGCFLQVAGLKFDVDPGIQSSVKLDEAGMFASVEGKRRVKNVKILCGDLWTDIDPDAVYAVTSIDYILKSQGDGYTMFKNAKVTCDSFMFAYESIANYITLELKGKVRDRYINNFENRINVK